MFGARKDDLPDIWEALNEAGFESGHAYGKSLRTVKSCVGTTCEKNFVYPMLVELKPRYAFCRVPLRHW